MEKIEQYVKLINDPQQRRAKISLSQIVGKTSIKRTPSLDPSKLDSVYQLLKKAFTMIVNQKGREVSLITPHLDLFKDLATWICGIDGAIPANKSLYLMGKPGNGKSTIAAAVLTTVKYLVANGHIEDTWIMKKYDMEDIYFQYRTSNKLEVYDGIEKGHALLDELKVEHFDNKHYGELTRMIPQLLTMRHSRWEQFGQRTIITTNIPLVPIKAGGLSLEQEIKDDRLYSRMTYQYHEINCLPLGNYRS